jgi:hypothetical protein
MLLVGCSSGGAFPPNLGEKHHKKKHLLLFELFLSPIPIPVISYKKHVKNYFFVSKNRDTSMWSENFIRLMTGGSHNHFAQQQAQAG